MLQNILFAEQYGFCSGRSTQDAVADLVEYVTKNLDRRCSISAPYIDVAKAFDSINHNILLYDLHKCGFRGCIYD